MRLFVTIVAAILLPELIFAQSRSSVLEPSLDSRGKPEITICNQNLENYGTLGLVKARVPSMTAGLLADKEEALLKRFAKTGCDVIAVQELLGESRKMALASMDRLVGVLKKGMNREFEGVIGDTNEGPIRVGFLVAKDRAEIVNMVSYAKVELPKFTEKQRPRLFGRGPLEIQIKVKGRGESGTKTFSLITFHFKARSGAMSDPTGLEWETYRIEMAEAMKRIIENRFSESLISGAAPLIVLGDRNSNFDLASAKILEGVLKMKDFQGTGPCRLSNRGVPLCQAGAAGPQMLFSVLTLDPETKLQPGTFEFENVYSWIDDILMPAPSLPYAWISSQREGDYDSGVVYEPKDASDHALAYVRLNW